VYWYLYVYSAILTDSTTRHTHSVFVYEYFFLKKSARLSGVIITAAVVRTESDLGKRVTAAWTRGGYHSRPFIDSINAIRMCTYVQHVYIYLSHSAWFGVGCVHWLQVVVIEGSRVADYVRVYMRARWLRRVRPVKPQRGLPRRIIIMHKCARSNSSSSSSSSSSSRVVVVYYNIL
jgi:hypothetical protein